jgi:hypothetical protein
MTLTPFWGSLHLTSVESIEGFPQKLCRLEQKQATNVRRRDGPPRARQGMYIHVQAHADFSQEGLAGMYIQT